MIFNGDFFKLYENNIEKNSIDLIICDGPYSVLNFDWDRIKDIQKFNYELLSIFETLLKPGGIIYLFGKHFLIDFIDYTLNNKLLLNARLIWYQPAQLRQGKDYYTNNYDTIAYFSKGNPKTFNLDDIRIPQVTDLMQRKRCENVPSVKNGKFNKTKFNENGKNPGDVIGHIASLTYRSKELLDKKLRTIQKPEKLISMLIKASSNINDLILDPFSGTGTTAKVCKELNRNYICFEKDKGLYKLSENRIK